MLEQRKQQPLEDDQSHVQLFNSIPLSSAECLKTYEDLAVFKFDGVYYRPTAKQLQQAWQDIITTVLSEGIDIGHGSVLLASDISRPLEESGWPAELVMVIVERLGSGAIDEKKALEFVGIIMLEAETLGGKSMSTEAFLERWRNGVPEQWRGSVNLDILEVSTLDKLDSGVILTGSQGRYQIIASNIVATSYRDQDIHPTDATASANGDAGMKKRKWHEKLGASRKR